MKALHLFLTNHFPGLVLRPSLFYSWKTGIRFEICDPDQKFLSLENQQQMRRRANVLFEQVISAEDELLLVTDVHASGSLQKPVNVYRKYIRSKNVLRKLQHAVLPNVFEDEGVTHRFVLPCQKKHLRHAQLLQAILWEDWPHPSTILKNDWKSGYDIYVVNITRKIIFHLYDDRGCDVIAADRETIRFLYENENDWILDYDRDVIDRLFQL